MPAARIASTPSSSSPLRGTMCPAPMVAQVVRGDATVLADFRRDRYYTLSPVSGRIWTLLGEGITLPALLAQLHAEYEAPAERIDADAVAFLETLRAAGLITCQPAAGAASSRPENTRHRDAIERDAAAPAVEATSVAHEAEDDAAARSLRVPSVLHVGLLILGVKVGLRLLGFARTWRWMHQRMQGIAIRADVPATEVAAIEYRVALAAALWPGRALCLEQSLVLYYVLRSAGVIAEFRMGVQPHPFLSHAWVEYRGAPVNDFPEHVAQLQPLEGLPQ